MTLLLGSPFPSTVVLGPHCEVYIYPSQTSPIHKKLVAMLVSEDSRIAGDGMKDKMTLHCIHMPFKLCINKQDITQTQ